MEVVAAIIEKDGKILICRRAENKTRALKWEFPGGKIEPGETPEQAVLRECREELDVDLCVKGEFMRVLHSYPDIEIQLTVFRTAIIGSDPRCIEHKEILFCLPVGTCRLRALSRRYHACGKNYFGSASFERKHVCGEKKQKRCLKSTDNKPTEIDREQKLETKQTCPRKDRSFRGMFADYAAINSRKHFDYGLLSKCFIFYQASANGSACLAPQELQPPCRGK